MVSKESYAVRNTDAFFFDENCILQEELIEKNTNNKGR